MVFKKLLSAMGVGGPSVETVLHDASVTPGGSVRGQVTVAGGDRACDVRAVNIALATRVEIESGEGEYSKTMEFARGRLADEFQLTPGAQHSFPFQLPAPWETPITMRGTNIGVATELDVAGAVDATDLDPVTVAPLPAQERILQAISELGFRFHSADCERGRAAAHQELPFYQEIEYYPPQRYARAMNQLEVTFVTNASSMEVILELDKRGGLLSEGHDSFGRFPVDFATVNQVDWEGHVDGFLEQACKRRGLFF